jgi:GT2 family glycosyltransferase
MESLRRTLQVIPGRSSGERMTGSMTGEPKVFIVLLNWNGLRDTIHCLDSIRRLDYMNYEVIIVDNGSSDDSVSHLKKNYPWITLIESSRNLGYTGGNNLAMRHAIENHGDYIWLVNNDTVLNVDSLRKLVALAETTPSIGLLSPLVFYLDHPDAVQFAGSVFDWKNLSFIYTNVEDERGGSSSRTKPVCLWGTSLLVKGSVVKQIGYLKDEYFAYWEDTEYSLRALRHGFQNVVCREAKVFHRASMTRREYWARGDYYFYYISRNLILMAREYVTGRVARLNAIIRCLAGLSDELRFVPSGYEYTWDVRLLGTWHGLKGVTGAMRKAPSVPALFRHSLRILSRCHPLFLAALLRLDWTEMSGRYRKSRKEPGSPD